MGPTAQIAVYFEKSGIWGPLRRLRSILAEQERRMGPTAQIAVYFEKSGIWGPLRRLRSILKRAAYGAHCADGGLF